MKKFFRDIHLYLSLASGLVIAIVCLTGAILVFEKEMQMSIYPERYKVTSSAQKASIQQAVNELETKVPGAKVNSIKIYSDPTRTWEVGYSTETLEKKEQSTAKDAPIQKGESKEKAAAGKEGGKKKGGGKGGNSQAFMNPYTGELISLYSYRTTFFFTAFSLHRWLMADDIGKMIVGVSTIMFLFILITGIVLWWPKKIKMLKQRLTLKWNAGWKRVNHDLHITIGFYTAIFLFVFAFTGLAWSFEWFNDGIYWVTGTENKRPETPKLEATENAEFIGFDRAYAAAKQYMPNAEYYSLSLPKDPSEAMSINVMPADAVHERASSQLYINPYTGEKIGELHFADRNLGQRVRATFYPVHVGSIAGMPGRIIAFITCIAGFTFPITGVILWINRLNKKKDKKVKKNKSTLSVQ